MVEYSKTGLEKQLHLNLDKFHKTRADADEELRKLTFVAAFDLQKSASEKLIKMNETVESIQGGLF
jgi:hypothetical protein